MTRANALGVILVAAVVLGGCAGQSTGSATPEPTSTTTAAAEAASNAQPKSLPTVLILDASGSMKDTDAPGPRIDAAKRAATGLVAALPDGARLGLVSYGTRTGSSPEEQAAGCKDVTAVLPVSVIDRAVVDARIAELTPNGYTPIGMALTQSAAMLPTDTAAAIVLVSDGEDTCAPPAPCEVARQIHASHPRLAISTVGFKTNSEELACIASTTGGLYVTAANASQLAARLLATQDREVAKASLSNAGLDDVTIGQRYTDIAGVHPDLPAQSAGRKDGDLTVIDWRDCDFGFDEQGVLTRIAPHNGGRTIDGVAPGQPIARASELYGPPVATTRNPDDATTGVYTADEGRGTAYRITYTADAGVSGGTITRIVLCRCLPKKVTPTPPPPPKPPPAAFTFGGYGSIPGPRKGRVCSRQDQCEGLRGIRCVVS